MTPLAIGEVVASEGALIVVTRHAGLGAVGAEMLNRSGRGDLSSLRHACSNAVAIVAAQVLARAVTRVAEIDSVSFREDRSSRELPRLVTRAARRYVAPGCLRARRVTLVTGRVSINPFGDRKGHAARGRLMTTGAIDSLVPRVIKLHVKAL